MYTRWMLNIRTHTHTHNASHIEFVWACMSKQQQLKQKLARNVKQLLKIQVMLHVCTVHACMHEQDSCNANAFENWNAECGFRMRGHASHLRNCVKVVSQLCMHEYKMYTFMKRSEAKGIGIALIRIIMNATSIITVQCFINVSV